MRWPKAANWGATANISVMICLFSGFICNGLTDKGAFGLILTGFFQYKFFNFFSGMVVTRL
jgi:hypothetical protein